MPRDNFFIQQMRRRLPRRVELWADADIRKAVLAQDAGTEALKRATWILVVIGLVSAALAAAPRS